MKFIFDYNDIFSFFLILARFYAALTICVGFAENTINQRTRLYVAIFVSLCFWPFLHEKIIIENLKYFIVEFVTEGLIGLFVGTIIRFVFIGLDMLGALITNQSGLSFASFFSNMFHEQMSSISILLTLTGTLLFFNLDFDYLFFKIIICTYNKINFFGNYDFIELLSKILGQSLTFAVTMGFPFITVQLVLLIGIGLVNKFTPQIQLYFISHPVQIVVTSVVLVVTITSIMHLYLDYLKITFEKLL